MDVSDVMDRWWVVSDGRMDASVVSDDGWMDGWMDVSDG